MLSDGNGVDGVPSDQPTQSRISHAILGPGIAIYDNRSRTKARLILWIAMVPLGMFGLSLGRGDIASGSTIAGIAQALGGVVLAAYSILAAVADARRLAMPIRLVIARDGFAPVPGNCNVSWDEIEAVSDRRSPAGQPRTLRVHLIDPGEFERRHALSPFARLALRFNRGDLLVGDGLAVPVVKAETLMRAKLADYQRLGTARSPRQVHSGERTGDRSRHKR